MADMKMRREGEGYRVVLTPGQQKKWVQLQKETLVKGLFQNKKWNSTEYALAIGDDTYDIAVLANEKDRQYKVTATHKEMKQSIERTYKTYECNDCVMRMALEIHNRVLAMRKELEAKAKENSKAVGQTAQPTTKPVTTTGTNAAGTTATPQTKPSTGSSNGAVVKPSVQVNAKPANKTTA
jgi:hypothetical protein